MMGQIPSDNYGKIMDINTIIDSMTEKELYDLFITINDIPVHPNCRCEVDNNLWLIMPGACKHCRQAQKEFNDAIAKGNFDFAMEIFNKHSGKKREQ